MNQPVVTHIWKRFFIFQEPRQRQTSVLVCALVKQSLLLIYPLTEGVACGGPCFSNPPPAPTRPGNPGVGRDHGNQEALEDSCSLPQPLFPYSQPFSTVPRVLNFENILFSVLRCCLLICLFWSRKVFRSSRNGSLHLRIYKSPL